MRKDCHPEGSPFPASKTPRLELLGTRIKSNRLDQKKKKERPGGRKILFTRKKQGGFAEIICRQFQKGIQVMKKQKRKSPEKKNLSFRKTPLGRRKFKKR